MKKTLIAILMVPLCMAFASCDKDSGAEIIPPEPEPPVEDEEVVDNATDLSAEEMANCYIVRAAGTYKFKADNQFNLGEGLPAPAPIHPSGAVLVWQTEKGLIKNVKLDDTKDVAYIRFEVTRAEGNAVIAAVDAEDNVVWSWHIWMPVQEVSSVVSSSGYEVMNMNLGAMNNTPGDAMSYGMLYQWGRKDPFPTSATLTGTTATVGAPLYDIDGNSVEITNSSWTDASNNTMAYAISHPAEVLSNYAQYAVSRDWLKSGLGDDSLWGNPRGDVRDPDTNAYLEKGQKTCYDPSPAGWRVAPPDAFRDFTSSGGYAWTFDDFNIEDINHDGLLDMNDYNYGWHFMVNANKSLYFPAASRYDGSYAMLMGSMSGLWGNYWSNAPSATLRSR